MPHQIDLHAEIYIISLGINFKKPLKVKGYLNNKQVKKTKRHARHKDRKFLDALATDKFYLEDMIKQFSSDTRATSRNNKNIITEVSFIRFQIGFHQF